MEKIIDVIGLAHKKGLISEDKVFQFVDNFVDNLEKGCCLAEKAKKNGRLCLHVSGLDGGPYYSPFHDEEIYYLNLARCGDMPDSYVYIRVYIPFEFEEDDRGINYGVLREGTPWGEVVKEEIATSLLDKISCLLAEGREW